jgi:triphosphatase
MNQDQEIEAKFRVTDPAALESLRTASLLVQRFPLSDPVLVINEDTYFDTLDARLLRHGFSLRIRTDGQQVLTTVKSLDLNTPKGVHKRLEVERAAPALDPSTEALVVPMLPPDVAAALAETIDEKDTLLRKIRLRQERQKREVFQSGDNSELLGELSLDRVEVLTPDSSRDQWRIAGSFDAVEMESASDGTQAELRTLAIEIAQTPGLKPDSKNKLFQALECVNESTLREEGEIAHLQHVAELCRGVWRGQHLVMLLNEAGVRDSDDIEYVHDMRVATRRARAAGRLYGGYFKKKSKSVPRFMSHLRSTGRLLGAVRDMDVALDNLSHYRAEAADAPGEGLDDLALHWLEKRDRAQRKLLHWLDGKRYRHFVADFGAFCNTRDLDVPEFEAEAGVAPLPHQVRHVLPSMIMARFEAIRAFEVLFEAEEPVPVPSLHALRIECKYLRYHLEFSAHLLGAEGAALIGELKALQEHLGQLNDASVAHTMLDKALESLGGEGIAAYRQLQVDAVEHLRAAVPADLARFLSDETRQKMALALARI